MQTDSGQSKATAELGVNKVATQLADVPYVRPIFLNSSWLALPSAAVTWFCNFTSSSLVLPPTAMIVVLSHNFIVLVAPSAALPRMKLIEPHRLVWPRLGTLLPDSQWGGESLF